MLVTPSLQLEVVVLKCQVVNIWMLGCGIPFTNSLPRTVSHEYLSGVISDIVAQICALPTVLHLRFSPGKGADVFVGVTVGVGVRVLVGVGVGVRVLVAVGVGVRVLVAVAVGVGLFSGFITIGK